MQSLDATPEELQRIQESFKNEEFRKLFLDYVNEISDPKNRQLYEDELRALEGEQGNDVRFVNPTPEYVVKTRIVGQQKVFINICTSVEIATATPQRMAKGINWSIPYSLGKPRDDFDKSDQKCTVYDCVFHPDTLSKGIADARFKQLLISTAIEGIETQFQVKMEKDFTLPKMKSKGSIPSTVIRVKKAKPVTKKETTTEYLSKVMKSKGLAGLDTLKAPEPQPIKEHKKTIAKKDVKPTVQTPKYTIIHQGIINDYQNFTNAKEKQVGARPDALVVRIELPLVSTVSQIELDTLEKSLEMSVKDLYKLSISLPFSVLHDKGTAKFEKLKRELVVTLPVVPAPKADLPIIPVETLVETIDESLGLEKDETLEKKLVEMLEPIVVADPPIAQTIPPTITKKRVPIFYMRQDLQTVSFLLPVSGIRQDSAASRFGHLEINYEFSDGKHQHQFNVVFPQPIKASESKADVFLSHALLTFEKLEPNLWTHVSIKTPYGQSLDRQFKSDPMSPIEEKLWNDTREVLEDSIVEKEIKSCEAISSSPKQDVSEVEDAISNPVAVQTTTEEVDTKSTFDPVIAIEPTFDDTPQACIINNSLLFDLDD